MTPTAPMIAPVTVSRGDHSLQHHRNEDAGIGDDIEDEAVLEVEVDDVDEDRDPEQVDQQARAERLVRGKGAETDRAERR